MNFSRILRFAWGLLLCATYAAPASAAALPDTIPLESGGAPFTCDKEGTHLFLSDFGKIIIYDIKSQKNIKAIELEGAGTPSQLKYIDNKLIVLTGGKIFVIGADKGEIIREIKLPGDVYSMSVSEKSPIIYVIVKGTIFGYDAMTGKEVFKYKLKKSDTSSLQASSSGQFLVFYSSLDNHFTILDTKTKKENIVKIGDYDGIDALTIAPDSKSVYVMISDTGLKVLNLKGKVIKTIKNSYIYSNTMFFSPNGKYLVVPKGMTQKENDTIGILSVKQNKMLPPLRPPLKKDAAFANVIMLPDNNTIIFTSTKSKEKLFLVRLKQ